MFSFLVFCYIPRMEHLHTKNTAKIIVIDRFGQGQSIKEVGFRRFVESLYEVLLIFRVTKE